MAATNEREQQIQQILDHNWQAFVDWQERTGSFGTLAMPNDIASVFIPKRTLELSDDPERVRVICFGGIESQLGFILYESLRDDISKQNIFDSWVKRVKGRGYAIFPANNEEAPPGLDFMHCHFHRFITGQRLSLSDMIYIYYNMGVERNYPAVVTSINLFDRPDMHRRGVGTSFYQRLEAVLKQLGFNFLMGEVMSPHPSFFDKGRANYHDLPEDIKLQLPVIPSFRRYMVKTL